MRRQSWPIAVAPASAGRSDIHKSTNRILTTHAGSIPRGEPLGAMLIDEEAGKPVDKGALQSNIDLRVSHVLAKGLREDKPSAEVRRPVPYPKPVA